VLVVAPPLAQSYAQHLVDGLKTSARENGIELTVLPNITSDDEITDIECAVKVALSEMPDVDAIVAASTLAAMAAVSAMEQNGKVVGTDIDVISKEVVPYLKLFRSEILTLSEEVGTAGAFLAKAAIHAIRNPDEPPMQYLEVPSGHL
jgi:LacI family transcriptional regulator